MNPSRIAYENRLSAIASNCYYLEKWDKEDNLLSDSDIIKAAKWNFKTFGYGYVSYDKYIEYLEKKRTTRLYNIDVSLWYKLLSFIFKRDNYTCQYCGSIGGKLEGDHIIPISKGGTNDLENLTTSCRKCNRQKKDKTVEEFIEWRNLKYG